MFSQVLHEHRDGSRISQGGCYARDPILGTIYVTKFAKTRLPHRCNSLTLTNFNMAYQHAIDLTFLHNASVTLQNYRLKFGVDDIFFSYDLSKS